MYFKFFNFTLYIIKKSRVDQLTKLFCTDGTTKTHFTEIKSQFRNVIKKKGWPEISTTYAFYEEHTAGTISSP